MADYGIKVSQSGHDVNTAADYELLFNSAWPLLKLEEEGNATIDVAQDSVVTTHNLGFPPFFWYFDVNSSFSEFISYYVGDSLGQCGINDTEFKFFTDGFSTGTQDIHYFIFRLDISKNFTAPDIRTEDTTRGALASDYGVKVSEKTKQTSSGDIRDFSIHSSSRSPLIEKVETDTQSTSGNERLTLTSNHGLSYIPLGYGFLKGDDVEVDNVDAGYWQNAVATSQNIGVPIFNIGQPSHELFIDALTEGTYSFSAVTLKDPFDISENTIEVTH